MKALVDANCTTDFKYVMYAGVTFQNSSCFM